MIAVLTVAGCGGGGGGGKAVVDPADTTVDLSGILSANSTPIEGALVIPYAMATPDVPMFSAKDTDGSGAYTIIVFEDTPVSLEFSKLLFATVHTRYATFSANTAGLNFETVSVADAETIIDTAFGGMMLDLADKAWLAIDVVDSMGANVNGVIITPTAAPSGGGALTCLGVFSGVSITIAPCMPDRSGPMYLAYYDADSEISIVVGSTTINAPVRLGEITVINVEQ